MGSSCPCICHLNKFNPCDLNGGCGTNHRSSAGDCVTCPVLRPRRDPRKPNQPPVCDGDRVTIGRYLGEIADLIAELTNPEQPILDDRQYERFGIRYLRDGYREIVSLGVVWADPLTAVGGVGPISSPSLQPRVTGSHEPPIPINPGRLDLASPLRITNTQTGADWPEDQVGHLAAATVLDEWIRDIRGLLYPDHHLPPATVDEMVLWLRTPVGDERTRIDDICERHPQVADFAAAVKILRGSLRGAAGAVDPKPERCALIECRQCDRQMLFKQPGGDVTCANPDCRAVLRPTEYDEWAKVVVAKRRIEQQRHAAA